MVLFSKSNMAKTGGFVVSFLMSKALYFRYVIRFLGFKRMIRERQNRAHFGTMSSKLIRRNVTKAAGKTRMGYMVIEEFYAYTTFFGKELLPFSNGSLKFSNQVWACITRPQESLDCPPQPCIKFI